MAGEIINRGEKTWLVRIFLGRDPLTGKRKWHTHTLHGTKKEAQSYLTAILRERDLGRFQEPTRLTVSEFLVRWLADAAAPKLRERTHGDCTEVIRRYISEPLGYFRLPQLTPLAVQNLYGRLKAQGLGAATIRKVHVVLSSALDQAVRWGMLAHNPARSAELPRLSRGQKKQKMLVLSPEEAGIFLKACAENRWGTLLSFALQTGARPGEYLALQWNDIDWRRQAVRIRRTLFRPRSGGGWRFEETKTCGSVRSVSVAKGLLARVGGPPDRTGSGKDGLRR